MIYTKGKVTYYMEKSNVPDFETATGTIDYGFTNDYVFRKILQENNDVLKALICSILHMKPDGVEVTVTNPISLGETFSAKDFILDVRVVLNDGRLIDLEMQMTNEYNWPDRSISYASRNFDQLKRGEYYIDAKPVHSIGFLNFTLFKDNPEFNALYQLLNVKTKRLYSEKFSIHVIDLSRIDLATEEDRHYGIERWAKLFKTKTWEDLRMITKNNETMQKAADSLYQLNSDAVARQCAQSRADAAYWEAIKNNKLHYLEETNAQLQSANTELQSTNTNQAVTIAQQTSKIDFQSARIAELEAELAQLKK